MSDQEPQETPQTARPLLSDELERIKSVIDRVLWTAGATEWNKRLLAEAIAEEIGDIAAAEREACAKECERTGELYMPQHLIMRMGADDCADAIRKRSNDKLTGRLPSED